MCDVNILWVELLLMACLPFAVLAFIIYVVAESNKPKPGSDPPCADEKLTIDSPPDLA